VPHQWLSVDVSADLETAFTEVSQPSGRLMHGLCTEFPVCATVVTGPVPQKAGTGLSVEIEVQHAIHFNQVHRSATDVEGPT